MNTNKKRFPGPKGCTKTLLLLSGNARKSKEIEIGFVIKDDQLLANEYDLVVGNKFNMQEMKDILPDLAEHPLVVKAADEITKLLPELNGTEKVAIKDAEKEESVSKKIKEKAKTARPKKAKTSKKKEEVAI